MTVQELIAELQQMDPERLIVMAKDAEGNGYSPLSSMWEGGYAAESTYSGEAGLEELTEEDKKDGYVQEDVVDGVPALVLCPTN